MSDRGTTAAATVEVLYRKYDGTPHRRITERLIGEDEHGIWLGSPTGTLVEFLSAGHTINARQPAVRLIPRTGWFTAVFFDQPSTRDVYVDITTPARWVSPTAVTMYDLDLDLIRDRADGAVRLVDEDEFAVHRVRYGYSTEVIHEAQLTADTLAASLRSYAEPFGAVPLGWLDHL